MPNDNCALCAADRAGEEEKGEDEFEDTKGTLIEEKLQDEFEVKTASEVPWIDLVCSISRLSAY